MERQIIECRECKYGSPCYKGINGEICYCNLDNQSHSSDFYCGYAETRDEWKLSPTVAAEYDRMAQNSIKYQKTFEEYRAAFNHNTPSIDTD